MCGIQICGTGSYLPEAVVTNDDMAKLVDTSDEWISTRTGIRSRHITGGEPTSLMGLRAAQQALDAAGVSPQEIDMIVCSTITPDMRTPSVACILQGKLGAKNAFALDISCACSGFVYALDLAQKYLSSGMVKTALVVSAEALTHVTNFEDRTTCVLFGDGAGACVVRSAPHKRYASFLGADGLGAEHLYISAPSPRTPFETEKERQERRAFDYQDDGFVHMNGQEVYKFSTAAMPMAIKGACGQMGVQPEELQLIVPHQANVRIISTAMKFLHLPLERAYINIAHVGNTSSASVPIALDEAARAGLIREGELIALVGFGAGLTFGASVVEW